MSENKGNKLVVDDIEVIVRGIANKPYYEIKYREVGNDDYNIGFGSYDLNNVLKWKEEEFEVVSEKEEKESRIDTEQMKEIITALVDASALNVTNWMSAFTMAKEDAYRKSELDRVRMAGRALAANENMLEILLPMQAVLHKGKLEDIEQGIADCVKRVECLKNIVRGEAHGEKKRYEKPSIKVISKEELKAEVEKCIAKVLGF